MYRFEVGHRVPNIGVADHTGRRFSLYNSTKGGPIVLVFLSGEDAAQDEALLRAFQYRAQEIEGFGTELFVFSMDSQEANARLVDSLGLPFRVFSDPDHSVTAGVPGVAGAALPASFVLDPNLRIVGIHPKRQADVTVAQVMGELVGLQAKGEPRVHSSVAPVLFVPNVLDRPFCKRLVEHWEREGHEEGLVRSGADESGRSVKKVDPTYKLRRDHRIIEPVLINETWDRMKSRIGPEVYKVHYYGNWDFEGFRIGGYRAEDAGFFRLHRDNVNQATAHRRYGVSVLLNEDYEGGELAFPEYGADLYKPPAGCAVIFSCSVLHGVCRVTRGVRFVLLTFIIEGGHPSAQRRLPI